MIECKNIFYFYMLNDIGGVETFFYYIAKKYFDFDITIYYSIGNEKQINRLKKYVRVKKWSGENIKCEKAFFNYKPVIIDYVDAKEYIQVIHLDYKLQNIKPVINPKITKYIGVSKQVCNSFKELTGIDAECIYNPIEVDKPEKTLLIVSATRLTKEKGKKNIIKIGNKLNEKKLPYLWLIFTNDTKAIDNPNIIYMKPTLDIASYLKKADIVAQLSSSEAYGFTPNEALLLGTPVLLMDLPIWKELKIKNGVHGWIIDDIDNFDVNKLYKELPKIEYHPPIDMWDKVLAPGKSKYKEDMKVMVKVRGIIKPYFIDVELHEKIPINHEYKVNKVRAEDLVEKGLVEIVRR